MFQIFLKIHYFSVQMTPKEFSPEALITLANYRMPFGKYSGRYLSDLPLPYLVWFRQKGFPEGKLGQLLRAVLEVKENGLEALLIQIRKDFPADNR